MFNKKVAAIVGGAVLASVAAFAVIAGTISAQRGSGDAVRDRVEPASESIVSANPARIAKMAGMDMDGIKGVGFSQPDDDDVTAMLSRLVSSGKITQADADALTAWHDSKPEITVLADQDVPKWFVYEASGEVGVLPELVTEGVISQGDADALSDWAASKPEVAALEFDGRGLKGDFSSAGLVDGDYDVTEDLARMVERGILTQADSDALQAWLDTMPDIDFPEGLGYKEAYESAHADGDVDTGSDDLASELAEAVAAGDITQADADALLAWYNGAPDVSFNIGTKAKAWIFRGEGDSEHDGIGAMFDKLAEMGMVTDAQADEIETWVNAAPDFSFSFGRVVKAMADSDSATADASDADGLDPEAILSQAVTKQVLSQADADALIAWWNAKPTIVQTLLDGMEGMFGRGIGLHDSRMTAGSDRSGDGGHGDLEGHEGGYGTGN